jgi:hypothetical protein
MATTIHSISLRSGLEEERQQVILKLAEPAYCTDSKQFYIGDGVTPGGVLVGGGTDAIQNTTIVQQLTPPAGAGGQITISDDTNNDVTLNISNFNHASLNAGADSNNNIGLDWSYANGPRLISNDSSDNLRIIHNGHAFLDFWTAYGSCIAKPYSAGKPAISIWPHDDDPGKHAILQLGGQLSNTIAFSNDTLISKGISINNNEQMLRYEQYDANWDWPGQYNLGVNSDGTGHGALGIGTGFSEYGSMGQITSVVESTLPAGDPNGELVIEVTLETDSDLQNIKYNDFLEIFNIPTLSTGGRWSSGVAGGVLFPVLKVDSSAKKITVLHRILNGAQGAEQFADLVALSGETMEGPSWTKPTDANAIFCRRQRRQTIFTATKRTAAMTQSNNEYISEEPANHQNHISYNRITMSNLPVVDAANVANINFIDYWQLYVDSNGFLKMNLPELVRDSTNGTTIAPSGHVQPTQGTNSDTLTDEELDVIQAI